MGESVSLGFGGRLARIGIDRPGLKVNALSRAVLSELDEALAAISSRGDEVRGVIVASGKPGQFVAGADLKEILRLAEEEPGEVAAVRGAGASGVFAAGESSGANGRPDRRAVFGRRAGAGVGLRCADCVGGVGDAVGFPEVTIGLIPSWGGTQRLPRLIDPEAAARMVLGGVPIGGREAWELGVVDEVCGIDELGEWGGDWIERAVATGLWTERRMSRLGPVVGMPEAAPESRPDEEGQARAYDAAWGAMVEGAGVELRRALEVEAGMAVPLFLAEGVAGRIRAVLERRGKG